MQAMLDFTLKAGVYDIDLFRLYQRSGWGVARIS